MAAELGHALATEDPDRRSAGRALAARHTWDAAARGHLDFYRSLGARA